MKSGSFWILCCLATHLGSSGYRWQYRDLNLCVCVCVCVCVCAGWEGGKCTLNYIWEWDKEKEGWKEVSSREEKRRESRENSLWLILLNVVQPLGDIYCIVGILSPLGRAKPIGEGNLYEREWAALVQLSLAVISLLSHSWKFWWKFRMWYTASLVPRPSRRPVFDCL